MRERKQWTKPKPSNPKNISNTQLKTQSCHVISATMEIPRILGFEIVFLEQYIDINLYLFIITILNDNQIKSAD